MRDLEKYIVENRNRLNSDKPGSGHEKRFKKKLSQNKGIKRNLNFRHYLQIAASVAVILASGVVIVKSSKGSSKMAATPEVQEFISAKDYYATQVDEKFDQLAGFNFESENEKEILLRELSTMDEYYKKLLEDFEMNPGDDRVMSALIQHYQMKLDVMDQILEQLRLLETTNKNQEDEKSNV